MQPAQGKPASGQEMQTSAPACTPRCMHPPYPGSWSAPQASSSGARSGSARRSGWDPAPACMQCSGRLCVSTPGASLCSTHHRVLGAEAVLGLRAATACLHVHIALLRVAEVEDVLQGRGNRRASGLVSHRHGSTRITWRQHPAPRPPKLPAPTTQAPTPWLAQALTSSSRSLPAASRENPKNTLLR